MKFYLVHQLIVVVMQEPEVEERPLLQVHQLALGPQRVVQGLKQLFRNL